jgi:hypothetical protein
VKYNQPFDQPTLPDAPYVNGNPATGLQGSIPPAAAFEYPQRELQNFIVDSDLTPTNNDLHQVSRGVQNGVVCFGQDVGTANALSAVMTPIPNALFPGMTVRIKKAGSANTGATTLDIGGGTGAHAVKRATGADLVAGDLPANTVAEFVFDGSFWQMTNFQGFTATSTTINNFTYVEPYCVDTGTANSIVAPFSPVITTLAAGDRIKVKIAATNTGPTTIAVNAIAAKAVVRYSGIPLLANDIRAGQVLSLIYDGTSFQIPVNSPIVWKFDVATPPGTPASLLPGEYGILTFTNQTTLDFHVGLSVGTYTVELLITANNTDDANLELRPNGLTYSGKFNWYEMQHQTQGTDSSSGAPFIVDFPNVNCWINGSFWGMDLFDGPSGIAGDPNDIGPFQLRLDISTATPKKMIRMWGGIQGGPSIGFGVWNDANAWTTLGTFKVTIGGDPPTGTATISGSAIVRRWT